MLFWVSAAFREMAFYSAGRTVVASVFQSDLILSLLLLCLFTSCLFSVEKRPGFLLDLRPVRRTSIGTLDTEDNVNVETGCQM